MIWKKAALAWPVASENQCYSHQDEPYLIFGEVVGGKVIVEILPKEGIEPLK